MKVRLLCVTLRCEKTAEELSEIPSDMSQEIEDNNHLNTEANSQSASDSWSWLPHFSICFSVVVLVISLALITVLRCKSWDRLLECICAKRKQGMSNRMSSSAILPNIFSPLNCSSSATTTVSRQPAAANSHGQTGVSDTVVYSVITIRGSGNPAAASLEERTEYAAIKVTNFQESS
ncbi:hypothetical protein OJAV_G00203570 [Oryzias javanicus]|uniref:Uncharacterized protein n=1 Tax=Oryzias javanicus TaxID=123683 RepID=A0A3S2NW16_ORYJA|nr:hypothetical protein OJAV_G00203570 [Oryzias javanicus]